MNQFWLPAIGAFGFACIGIAVPRSLGVGYDQIGDVLNGRLAVGALAVLAIAKLVVVVGRARRPERRAERWRRSC